MFATKRMMCAIVVFFVFFQISPVLSHAVELPAILGTFGICPVEENTSIAIWVPLADGAAVEGISWYNNDGSVVFPEILAVAGEYGHPELLENATPLGFEISGESSQWSEYIFPQAISSSSTGLYLMVTLPAGSDYEGEGFGGGGGFGYFDGDVVNNGWVSGDGVFWYSINPNFQMGVLPIFASEKNGSILVLDLPNDIEDPETEVASETQDFEWKMDVSPNPFNAQTVVSFSLAEECQVDLQVYDLRGQLISSVFKGYLVSGDHQYRWGGKDNSGKAVASGVYIFKLVAGGQVFSSRTMLVK